MNSEIAKNLCISKKYHRSYELTKHVPFFKNFILFNRRNLQGSSDNFFFKLLGILQILSSLLSLVVQLLLFDTFFTH